MMEQDSARRAALAVVGSAAFGDVGDVGTVVPTYRALVAGVGESAAWVELHRVAESLADVRGWTGGRWYERLTWALDQVGWTAEVPA